MKPFIIGSMRVALAVAFSAAAAAAQSPAPTITDLGVYEPSEINGNRQVSIRAKLVEVFPGFFSSQAMAGLWKGGSVRELPIPTGLQSPTAAGLDDSGHVVGSASVPGPGCPSCPARRKALLWGPGDTVSVLPAVPWVINGASHAEAINAAGQIAGSSGDGRDLSRGGTMKAILWIGGAITELGPSQRRLCDQFLRRRRGPFL